MENRKQLKKNYEDACNANSKEIMREIKFRGKCYKGPYENYRIGKIA